MRPREFPLGNVTDLLTDGTHYTPPDIGTGIPFLTVKDVSEQGLDFDGCSKISPAEYEAARKQNSAPQLGDVLFSKDGTVGKVHLVQEARPFAVLSSLAILRPSSRLDPSYLTHFLRTPEAIDAASRKKTGSAIRRIVLRDLSSMLIPLPSLDEQRRIAAILDKADQLRRKRRQAIALLDSLTQSIFLEMFGDPVSNPKGWKWAKLGEIGELDRGISKHRPRNDPRLLGGKYPLIQTGAVSNSGGYIRTFKSTYSDFGLSQSKLWPIGTLCITIAANIASTGILTFAACFPDSVVGFKSPISGMSQYVRVWMSFLKDTLERIAPAVAQKNINLAILRELDIPLPSVETLQVFDRVMGKLLVELERLTSHVEHVDFLFASLQHRAFSGQL